MTPLVEFDFDFSYMSHILFRAVVFTLLEPFLSTFAAVGNDSNDLMLMMLRANVTLFRWHPILVSMLSSAVFANEFEARHLWMLLSVFLPNTVVVPRRTPNSLTCA